MNKDIEHQHEGRKFVEFCKEAFAVIVALKVHIVCVGEQSQMLHMFGVADTCMAWAENHLFHN